MPLPTPKKGESQSEFVSRCLSVLTSRGEGKDSSQRAAICHSQYRKKSMSEKFNKAYGTCQGPLDFPMRDEEARELEKNLESGEWSPFRKASADFECFIEGERADISIITDPSIDKDGEVIDPESIDFSHFHKNPVVAYNHNYSIPPLGKSIWQKKLKHTWKAKTVYTPRPEGHPEAEAWFPDSIFHMIKSGTMRGKSIGGAVKWGEPTEEDATRLGFDFKQARKISKSVQIYEYSVCPLGVNNNTVVELVSKGMMLPDEIIPEFPEVEEFLKKQLEQANNDDLIEVPIIKSFQTRDQYLRQRELLKQAKIQEVESKIPQMVEESLKRYFGKVC